MDWKALLTSKTIIGIVVAAASFAGAKFFAVELDEAAISELWINAVGFASLVVAFYGRVTAKNKIVKSKD